MRSDEVEESEDEDGGKYSSYYDEQEGFVDKVPTKMSMKTNASSGKPMSMSAKKSSFNRIHTRKERADSIRYDLGNYKRDFLNHIMDLFYVDPSALTTREIIAINNLLEDDDECKTEVAAELSKRKLDTLTK